MADSDSWRNRIGRSIGCLSLAVIIVLLAVIARLVITRPHLPPPTPTPTPLPPPVVTITSIRAAAELATVEYRAVAEVENERVPDDFRQWLGSKEQIIMLAYGDVKAGFDLSRLEEGDVWTDGTRVQLHLPPPEILSVSIDEKQTHIVHYEKGLLISHDLTLEGETRQMAKDAIRESAIEAEVLENAARYGQLYFENFLRSLGFTEVQVIVN
jgi:hypothetical protein